MKMKKNIPIFNYRPFCQKFKKGSLSPTSSKVLPTRDWLTQVKTFTYFQTFNKFFALLKMKIFAFKDVEIFCTKMLVEDWPCKNYKTQCEKDCIRITSNKQLHFHAILNLQYLDFNNLGSLTETLRSRRFNFHGNV